MHDLGVALADNVNVLCIHTARDRRPKLNAVDLAQRWGIAIENSRQMIARTTQRGLRSVLHPTLVQWYRTNDYQFQYRQLPMDLFTDTVESGIASHRGNNYARVFAHHNTWCKAYPMKTKGQVYEALSLLFAQEGVPNKMIMDGSKEQTMGEFRCKTRQAGCQVKQTEPYSPWQNAAEGAIWELKKGTARKMLRAGSPKVLWDDCIELESEIRLSMVNDAFELDGEVPKTKLRGETTNITHICEFGWWIGSTTRKMQ